MGIKGNVKDFTKKKGYEVTKVPLTKMVQLGYRLVGVDGNYIYYLIFYEMKDPEYDYLVRLHKKIKILENAGIKLVFVFDGNGCTKAKQREASERNENKKKIQENLANAKNAYQEVNTALQELLSTSKKYSSLLDNEEYQLQLNMLSNQKEDQECEVDKYDKQHIRITDEQKVKIKQLLDSMGILHLTANTQDNYEADHILAWLPLDAIITRDRDLFCHQPNTPIMTFVDTPPSGYYKHYKTTNPHSNNRNQFNNKRKQTDDDLIDDNINNNNNLNHIESNDNINNNSSIETQEQESMVAAPFDPYFEISNARDVFEKLSFHQHGIPFTRQDMIDFAIMVGCDYSKGLKKIGPANAWSLIQKYKLKMHKQSTMIQENQENKDNDVNIDKKQQLELKWKIITDGLTVKQKAHLNFQDFMLDVYDSQEEFMKSWNPSESDVLFYGQEVTRDFLLNIELPICEETTERLIKPPVNTKLVHERNEYGVKTAKRIKTFHNISDSVSLDA